MKSQNVKNVHMELSKENSNCLLIDVRSPEEYSYAHAAEAKNIPLETVINQIELFHSVDKVFLICNTGNRSAIATQSLSNAGLRNIYNVSGGTEAWQEAGFKIVQA
jgi:rhodanese-related sulfurtransferase